MKPRLALVGLTLACLAGPSCDPHGLGRPSPGFLVVGHHGAPTVAPENTVPSFEVAVALGANGIEFDVSITADGIAVAWHDVDPDSTVALARQSGGEGFAYVPRTPNIGNPMRRPVKELTLAELRANYGYADPFGQLDQDAVIPTVMEVFAWAKNEHRLKQLYLDFKFGPDQGEQAKMLLRGLAKEWQGGGYEHLHVMFTSTDRAVVDIIEAERRQLGQPAFRVAWDREVPGALEATLSAGLRDVSFGLTPASTYSGFKREVAEIVQAREEGKIDSIVVWTLDREMQLAEMLYYSVDGLITNDTALLHRMWRETQD